MSVMSVISDVAQAHRKMVNLGRQFEREISKGAAHSRVSIMGLGAGLQQSMRGLEELRTATKPVSKDALKLLDDALWRLGRAEESARVSYVNLGRDPAVAHGALKGSRLGLKAATRDVMSALRNLEWDAGRMISTTAKAEASALAPPVAPAHHGFEALLGQMAG